MYAQLSGRDGMMDSLERVGLGATLSLRALPIQKDKKASFGLHRSCNKIVNIRSFLSLNIGYDSPWACL